VTAAVLATAAVSVGAVAATAGLHPLVAFVAFLVALAVLLVASLAPMRRDERLAPAGRWLLPVAAVAVVADRHLFVSSAGVAPDDVLAVAAVIAAAAPRWRALGAALALAAYVVAAATLIAAKPYHSDAVVAAHGGAELLLAGRHPYADFDMIERLARFGLPPEFATPLEDGTRLRSLQYPALAILVPAPFVAAGLADVRALYLAEVVTLFALVVLSVAPAWRAVALAVCLGDLVVLDQFVLAGIDPLWALLVAGAWLARRYRWSAVLLGLAVAARQPAWLIAPFVIAWAWQRRGPTEALSRAAIAIAVAILVHVPFLIGAPVAVVSGIVAPALLPLEPWGIGPAKMGADGFLPELPRPAYLAAAGAAYLAALWAFATRRTGGRAAPLVLPLLPLWLAWRALQSYFAFLPLFAMTEASRYDRE
jgi:hypothetical protein